MSLSLPVAVVVSLVLAAPVAADPAVASPGPIRRAAETEAVRLATESRTSQTTSPAKQNWIQRHPVATATMAGFASCFLIGRGMGDDGVFDDFTREANGVLLGGICAGGAATVARIAQIFRR